MKSLPSLLLPLSALLLLLLLAPAHATPAFKYLQSRTAPAPPSDHTSEISDILEIPDISQGTTEISVSGDAELSFIAESDADLNAVEFQEPSQPFRRLGGFPDRATSEQQRSKLNGKNLMTSSLALRRPMTPGRGRLRTRGNTGKVAVVAKFRNAEIMQIETDQTNNVVGEMFSVRVRFLQSDGLTVCDGCVASASLSYNGAVFPFSPPAGATSWYSVSVAAVLGTLPARIVGESISGAKRSQTVVIATAPPVFAAVAAAAVTHTGTEVEVVVTMTPNPEYPVPAGKVVQVAASVHSAGDGALVCHVTGLSLVSPQLTLVAHIQNEWFDGVTGPFVLKDVFVRDLDTQAIITRVASIAAISNFSAAPSPSTSRARLLAAMGVARETKEQKEERMTMGRRPAHMAVKKAAMEAAASAGSGQHTLLVHGYCSDNVWGSQTGYFANAKVFLDLDASRSHDDFARRIDAFADSAGVSDCRIVAHSQGGMAALHLYTYYWSCLDTSSGGRLIQSVGTPYQGSALAGNLAAIGEVFGAGCGTNNDLTYSGAGAWLAGVPSWARAAVNYYTTSFETKWWRYDYCHLATDLFLSDPEDGATEKAYGQLSGGNNRGHKTGWCHTSSMRDPGQVTDGSRNSQMNSYAF